MQMLVYLDFISFRHMFIYVFLSILLLFDLSKSHFLISYFCLEINYAIDVFSINLSLLLENLSFFMRFDFVILIF